MKTSKKDISPSSSPRRITDIMITNLNRADTICTTSLTVLPSTLYYLFFH